MKTMWLEKEGPYDGRQLRPLFAYLTHGVMGDSIVAWRGSCQIEPEQMIDGEDLRDGSEIRGSDMIHFIVEVFDRDLYAGVAIQRLMASLAKDLIEERAAAIRLRRSGDDLYWNDKKLSISIAAKSAIATSVHFAMNVRNAGTPVPTSALEEDFQLDAKSIAMELMKRLTVEHESMLEATRKARPLSS